MPDTPLASGTTVGRYTVLHLVGSGSTGRVYAAYDSVLDRRIALKLLKEDADTENRLRHEAKAIARLSHPNVVGVHDVGRFRRHVFVAMDYVAGKTLTAWLRERPRPQREILTAFVAAARGLSAARRAGLAHRDFEPRNVMVGRDGSARVVDFGAERDREDDERSDQLSFCVALSEALGTGVSSRLRGILGRGLSAAPGDRWSSLEALVDQLERDPTRRRRRLATVALATVLAGLATVAAVHATRRSESLCRGGAAHLEGVWEVAGQPLHGKVGRREAVRAALVQADPATGTHTWNRVAATVGRYTDDWLRMYRETCEATHVRRAQSTEVLDLRMACLNQRRDSLQALVDVLAGADREIAANAVKAANELPGLERCADVSLLRATVEPPRDGETQRRVDLLRRKLASATALNHSGKGTQAVALGHDLLAEARAIAYPPAIAEVVLTLDNFEQGSFVDSRITDASLEEALGMALAWNRDDLAAEAATALVSYVGYRKLRPGGTTYWAGLALALLDRLGSEHKRERSWLLQNQAQAEQRAGDLRAALKHVREALALKKAVLASNDPDIGASLSLEADLLASLGDPATALQRNVEASLLVEQAYGEASTNAAMMSSNRGEYLLALGRPQEARPLFQLAAERFEAKVGPDNGYLAYPLCGLGQALLALGQPAEALPHLERAVRLREAHEPNAQLVEQARLSLAQARREARRASQLHAERPRRPAP